MLKYQKSEEEIKFFVLCDVSLLVTFLLDFSKEEKIKLKNLRWKLRRMRENFISRLHFLSSSSFLGWNKQIRFQFPLYCSFFPWPEIWDSYQIKVQSNLWITNTLWIQKCSFCWPVVVALWQLNILNRTPKKVVKNGRYTEVVGNSGLTVSNFFNHFNEHFFQKFEIHWIWTLHTVT